MNITLKINDIERTVDTAPSTTLLSALRGLHGVKFGDEDANVKIDHHQSAMNDHPADNP